MIRAATPSPEAAVSLPLRRHHPAAYTISRGGRAEPKTGGASHLVNLDARVGIIFNQKAHRNLLRTGALPVADVGLDWASPQSKAELTAALARFAARGVDVIVVDGGDGTIRDVITSAPAHFPGGIPKLVVVPSGKTNALALDLGIPRDLTLANALASIAAGRTRRRSPVEIERPGHPGPVLRGFLFGAGAFVKATALAQGVHRLGAFRGLAVGMSIMAAVGQTIFAASGNPWRRGERMEVDLHDGRTLDRQLYLLLGSTLERLPLGLQPFGRRRAGLKLLGIDAPPRRILTSVPALLAGSEAGWLRGAGYHRGDADQATVSLTGGFVLDGETFEGSELLVSRGEPIDFLVP